jgi:hypothetical protein
MEMKGAVNKQLLSGSVQPQFVHHYFIVRFLSCFFSIPGAPFIAIFILG